MSPLFLETLQLYKVESIGAVYMVAAGVPSPGQITASSRVISCFFTSVCMHAAKGVISRPLFTRPVPPAAGRPG